MVEGQHSATVLTFDTVLDSQITNWRLMPMNKHEFAGKMKELFPDGSDKAIGKLITYAHELEASETYSKDDFFSESYVAYNLAAHKFSVDAAMQVLKVCEESCFNPWEIIDATRLVAEGVSPDKLMDKAVEGTLNFVPGESDEIEAGLEALKTGTLKIPKPMHLSSKKSASILFIPHQCHHCLTEYLH